MPNQTKSFAVPVDFQVQNCGSLFLFHPFTDTARAWLAEHCPPDDEHSYFGGALVVEHRYVVSIVDRIGEDGLRLA